VVSALIVLTRHTNAIYLVLIPLSDPRMFWQRRLEVAGMTGLGALCLLPQLAVYHQATGHWFVSVYSELGAFDLRAPKALAVLVGSQKGLFVWSPVLLLAGAGWFVDHPLIRRWRTAAAAIFLLNLYLIASWSDWQFGGSFGHRGFTDGLAIGAVGLAAWFDRVAARPHARLATAVAAATLVLLSTFQMLQYWNGILPIADTTWAEYGRLFLRWR
jgi:hypothetical protein